MSPASPLDPGADGALAEGGALSHGCATRMRETEVDVLLLSLGADLPWLTGYEAMPLERLTMLVLPGRRPGDPRRARARGAPGRPRPAAVRDAPVGGARASPSRSSPAWSESGRGLAVSDRCWAAHLLELRASAARGALAAARARSSARCARSRTPHEIAALRAAGAAADEVAAALLGRRDRPHRPERGRGLRRDLARASSRRATTG